MTRRIITTAMSLFVLILVLYGVGRGLYAMGFIDGMKSCTWSNH